MDVLPIAEYSAAFGKTRDELIHNAIQADTPAIATVDYGSRSVLRMSEINPLVQNPAELPGTNCKIKIGE